MSLSVQGHKFKGRHGRDETHPSLNQETELAKDPWQSMNPEEKEPQQFLQELVPSFPCR